jgi:hypothetical protein
MPRRHRHESSGRYRRHGARGSVGEHGFGPDRGVVGVPGAALGGGGIRHPGLVVLGAGSSGSSRGSSPERARFAPAPQQPQGLIQVRTGASTHTHQQQQQQQQQQSSAAWAAQQRRHPPGPPGHLEHVQQHPNQQQIQQQTQQQLQQRQLPHFQQQRPQHSKQQAQPLWYANNAPSAAHLELAGQRSGGSHSDQASQRWSGSPPLTSLAHRGFRRVSEFGAMAASRHSLDHRDVMGWNSGGGGSTMHPADGRMQLRPGVGVKTVTESGGLGFFFFFFFFFLQIQLTLIAPPKKKTSMYIPQFQCCGCDSA